MTTLICYTTWYIPRVSKSKPNASWININRYDLRAHASITSTEVKGGIISTWVESCVYNSHEWLLYNTTKESHFVIPFVIVVTSILTNCIDNNCKLLVCYRIPTANHVIRYMPYAVAVIPRSVIVTLPRQYTYYKYDWKYRRSGDKNLLYSWIFRLSKKK